MVLAIVIHESINLVLLDLPDGLEGVCFAADSAQVLLEAQNAWVSWRVASLNVVRLFNEVNETLGMHKPCPELLVIGLCCVPVEIEDLVSGCF